MITALFEYASQNALRVVPEKAGTSTALSRLTLKLPCRTRQGFAVSLPSTLQRWAREISLWRILVDQLSQVYNWTPQIRLSQVLGDYLPYN